MKSQSEIMLEAGKAFMEGFFQGFHKLENLSWDEIVELGKKRRRFNRYKRRYERIGRLRRKA